jgi:hypothetical protein
MLDGLREQIEFLRQQLAEEREANRENRRIIGGLVQRVPELDVPLDVDDVSGVDRNTNRDGEPSKRRSWFYRFFLGGH